MKKLFVIKDGDGEYDSYSESICAIFFGPTSYDARRITEEWEEYRNNLSNVLTTKKEKAKFSRENRYPVDNIKNSKKLLILRKS